MQNTLKAPEVGGPAEYRGAERRPVHRAVFYDAWKGSRHSRDCAATGPQELMNGGIGIKDRHTQPAKHAGSFTLAHPNGAGQTEFDGARVQSPAKTC